MIWQTIFNWLTREWTKLHKGNQLISEIDARREKYWSLEHTMLSGDREMADKMILAWQKNGENQPATVFEFALHEGLIHTAKYLYPCLPKESYIFSDGYGYTDSIREDYPLRIVSRHGHTEMVKHFISNHANPSLALYIAVSYAIKGGLDNISDQLANKAPIASIKSPKPKFNYQKYIEHLKISFNYDIIDKLIDEEVFLLSEFKLIDYIESGELVNFSEHINHGYLNIPWARLEIEQATLLVAKCGVRISDDFLLKYSKSSGFDDIDDLKKVQDTLEYWEFPQINWRCYLRDQKSCYIIKSLVENNLAESMNGASFIKLLTSKNNRI